MCQHERVDITDLPWQEEIAAELASAVPGIIIFNQLDADKGGTLDADGTCFILVFSPGTVLMINSPSLSCVHSTLMNRAEAVPRFAAAQETHAPARWLA